MKELFDIRLHEAAEKEYNQLDGSVLDEVNKAMNELIFRYGKDKMNRMVKIIIEADYSHLGDSLPFLKGAFPNNLDCC